MTASVSNTQNKLNELLDAIRQEFLQVSQEANTYRLQNQKDYDFKMNQQLAEMQQIRNTVYELELTHRKMKDAYEEEIKHLKLGLEQRDHQIASLTVQQQQQQQQQQQVQQHLQQQQQQLAAASASVPVAQQPPATTSATATPAANTTTGSPSAFPVQASRPNLVGSQLPTTTLPVVSSNAQQQLPQQQLQQQQLQQQQPPPQVSVAPLSNTAINGSPTSKETTTLPSVKAPESTLKETEPENNNTSKINDTGSATTAITTAATETEIKPKEEDATPASLHQDHYLVPYNQRANHSKPIPPFLLDLDSQSVPDALKKQTNDYYILYNPALPREIDVELHKSLDHTSVVCCVKFSNDGEYLATGCNKTTQVYRVSDGSLVARLSDDSAANNHRNSITENNTTTSTDNNTMTTTTTTTITTTVMTSAAELAKGVENLNTSSSPSSDLYIRSVCFSPDGKFLATGAEDRLIRIWDIENRKIVMILQGHEQDIYSLDYFPSGDKLVSGSGDRTVRIWDLRTGQCSLTLSIEDGVTTVAVSPGDGKYIAAGSLDRAVRVWDSETGFLVERLDSENESGTGHKDSVYSVVFTRDGQSVVSGSLDRSVKLWNLQNANNKSDSKTPNSGTCEVTYIGHKDFVLSVATTQNDEYILSGSKDRGVLFWDKKSGNPLLMLQGHRNSVISVAVANGSPLGPEYNVFATGSGDCKARIWKYKKIAPN